MQDSTQKPEPKLLDQVRGKIRLKHYSIRTEQAYVDWIKRFVLHFGKRHPRDLGAAEVEQFLTHLAVKGKVAAATQNQAKSALLFLSCDEVQGYFYGRPMEACNLALLMTEAARTCCEAMA